MVLPAFWTHFEVVRKSLRGQRSSTSITPPKNAFPDALFFARVSIGWFSIRQHHGVLLRSCRNSRNIAMLHEPFEGARYSSLNRGRLVSQLLLGFGSLAAASSEWLRSGGAAR